MISTHAVTDVLREMRFEFRLLLPDERERVLVQILRDSTVLQTRQYICLKGDKKRVNSLLFLWLKNENCDVSSWLSNN